MARNRYYHSAHWRALRKAALERDGHRCTVDGCGRIATHVDHKVTRPNADYPTALDVLENLRSLCHRHDGQCKERPDGSRQEPRAMGCDASGRSVDPSHPWNQRACMTPRQTAQEASGAMMLVAMAWVAAKGVFGHCAAWLRDRLVLAREVSRVLRFRVNEGF